MIVDISYHFNGSEHTITDVNSDGQIDALDIKYPPGSPEAKAAWQAIDAQAHSEESIQQAKSLGYPNATGMYMGKVLVPGVGPDQGDFQLLEHKLVYSDGFDPLVAKKIAAGVKYKIIHRGGYNG